MKNKLFTIVTAILLLLACQKEENVEINQAYSIQEFKTDELVQKLISNNENFIDNMGSPNEESIQLLKKSKLNNNEQIQLSNVLGFKSLSDYNQFLKNQSELANTIKKKYSFLEQFSKNDIQNLLKEVNFNNLNSNKKSFMFGRRCGEKFKNCTRLSNIVYTAEILGCTATAMGIGTLTGGVGGVFFQLACGGTAIEHLQAMRNECELDYQDCIQ
ncbi:MAG: hypothetical protein K9G06_05465 [Chitinophagaceae bacterium]|nr:hypothetical protein [Chitinophagaceae bacterium]